MEKLSIIKAQIDINALVGSLRLSIEEVEKKKPDSTYIPGMKKHMDNMLDVYHVLRELEDEIKTLQKVAFNYHKENMDLKYENGKLKEQVKHLIEGI
jgi:hypothetical protein